MTIFPLFIAGIIIGAGIIMIIALNSYSNWAKVIAYLVAVFIIVSSIVFISRTGIVLGDLPPKK